MEVFYVIPNLKFSYRLLYDFTLSGKKLNKIAIRLVIFYQIRQIKFKLLTHKQYGRKKELEI